MILPLIYLVSLQDANIGNQNQKTPDGYRIGNGGEAGWLDHHCQFLNYGCLCFLPVVMRHHSTYS